MRRIVMANAKNEKSGENDGNAIETALAIASDGEYYVSQELMPEAFRKGRKVFVGYALTPEEREKARWSIHVTAFNVSVDVFAKQTGKARKGKQR
jgi:hypothetical protein